MTHPQGLAAPSESALQSSRNPACSLCDLHIGAHTVCLWGERRGAPKGKIRVMVLGENPGWEEDQQGRPFVGPSGRLLDEGLRAAGLYDDDIELYFTNVTKCTKGGATLLAAHIKACAPYLEEEIADFKPHFILALGNPAIQRLIGRGKVTEIAGQEIVSEKYGCVIMPALHPAAILRQEGRKSSWLLDLHRFARLVRGDLVAGSKPPVTVGLLTWKSGFPWKIARILTDNPCSFSYDMETNHLFWWRRDFKALTVAFSLDGLAAIVVPLWHPEADGSDEEKREWLEAMRAPMTTVDGYCRVAHNKVFDDPVWWRISGYLPHTHRCSLIDASLLDENRPKALKWLGRAVLGWPDWSEDRTSLESTPLRRVAEYNGYDAAAAILLQRDHFEPAYDSWPGLREYRDRIVLPTASALERMMVRGIYVDEATAEQRLIEARERAREAAVDIPVENPNSFQQIGEWLYSKESLPIFHLTEGGQPSTDENAINRLAQSGFPQGRKVLEYRKWARYDSTYLGPVLNRIESSFDGRDHPDYRVGIVETGRLSSSFHVTPRDIFVRSIYTAPPGWSLVGVDYMQVEARYASWCAARRPETWERVDWTRASLLRLFMQGRDPYVYLAAQALRKPETSVTKDERQRMGKVPVLAMIYRISPEGLREYAWRDYEIDYSSSEALRLHSLFHNIFPEIREWHQREENILRARGFARSDLGRYRRLPEAMGRGYSASAAINSGINAPVQGPCSDITQAAMIVLDQVLSPDEAFIVGNIHDQLLFQIRQDRVEDLTPTICRYMESAPLALSGLGLKMPYGLIKVESVVGPWGLGPQVGPQVASLTTSPTGV